MFTQSMYFRVASLPSRCGGYSDTVLTVKPREGGYASYGGRLRKLRREATQATEAGYARHGGSCDGGCAQNCKRNRKRCVTS